MLSRIKSFITNRFQIIKYKYVLSYPIQVFSGGSQDSHLAIAFIQYFNHQNNYTIKFHFAKLISFTDKI